MHELERLAFVPAAPCRLDLRTAAYSDLSLERAIVIDVYELTRGDLAHYRQRFAPGTTRRADEVPWRTEGASNDRREQQDLPAFLDWNEAREVAEWRGMRLPTGREWLHVAVGRRGLEFPWGADQASLANTSELGAWTPLPAGTFENGRSRPYGCYDLVGNVWEWVEDAVPGFQDSQLDLRATNGVAQRGALEPGAYSRGSSRRVSVMGGAYDTRRHPTFRYLEQRQGYSGYFFHARRHDPEDLSPSIGARMCADAETYLWEQAASWGEGPAVAQRLVAVGERWAEDDLARAGLHELLDELLQRPGAPDGLRHLAAGAGLDP